MYTPSVLPSRVALAVALALATGAIIAACAAATVPPPPSTPPPVDSARATVVSPPPVEPSAVAPASASAEVPPPQASAQRLRWVAPAVASQSPEGNELPALPGLYSALASIRAGKRTGPVRVLWLGDSHTQPDIWPAAVRTPFEERFGNAGPGFIHVGFNKWGYRHQGVTLSVQGKWLLEPKRMLSEKTWGDGILGLCGIRLSPEGGSSASVEVDSRQLPGPATWDLAWRPTGPNAALEIEVDGAPHRIDMQAEGTRGAIRHEVWSTAGPGGKLSVSGASHGVELMGVVVERAGATGVVFDILGLNGARAAHSIAWNEDAWVGEVARRGPDLLVLTYGTNESGLKRLAMSRFKTQLGTIVDRVRRASPDAECLIVGTMDRGGEEMSAHIEVMNEAQRQLAQEKGCAFWSAQKAMGGRGSIESWAKEEPPAAARDHVHLSSVGYRRLGGMLARDMLRLFDAGTVVSE